MYRSTLGDQVSYCKGDHSPKISRLCSVRSTAVQLAESILTFLQVWKAMDAISDRGVQSYLQHHYVIMQLVPTGICEQSSEIAGQEDRAITELPISGTAGSASTVLQKQTQEKIQEPQVKSGALGKDYCVESTLIEDHMIVPEKHSEEAMFKRQKASSQDEGSVNPAAVENASKELQQKSTSADLKESEEADQTHSADLKLSTERQLSLEQTKQLQPRIDDGLNVANRGLPWFLRIDRRVFILIGQSAVMLFCLVCVLHYFGGTPMTWVLYSFCKS